MMRYVFILLVLTFSLNSHALPPQVEADRLMLQAKAAMDSGDFKSAVEAFSAAEGLKASRPDTFSYHYGIALMKLRDYANAKSKLEQYLNATGSSGKFYREALEKYNEADKAEKDAVEQAATKARYEKIARQEADEQAATKASGYARFQEQSGTLMDNNTGLQWSQSDNGTDINWTEAGAYCADKGSGWRLPSPNELLGLADLSQWHRITPSRSLYVSPKFRLTSCSFWSSERSSSSEARMLNLCNTHVDRRTNGAAKEPWIDWRSYGVKYGLNVRALCVRP